jgi:predicted secreted protein
MGSSDHARAAGHPLVLVGTRLISRLLVVILGTSSVALAQPVDQQITTLHLTQTAERSVVRDLLRVELRVEETGADALAVQSAINRRMSAALDRARQVQGVRVETGPYGVGEERPEKGPSHWRGSQSLIVIGTDAASLLKLAGALQSDGLLMSSLGYAISPETLHGAEEDLTAEALAALDRRAASIADRMHLRVLRFRNLQVGNAETGRRPVPRFAAMATTAPVAEPGEGVIRVTIEAELLLGPPRP